MVFYIKDDALSTIVEPEEAMSQQEQGKTIYIFGTDEVATREQIAEAIEAKTVTYDVQIKTL